MNVFDPIQRNDVRGNKKDQAVRICGVVRWEFLLEALPVILLYLASREFKSFFRRFLSHSTSLPTAIVLPTLLFFFLGSETIDVF